MSSLKQAYCCRSLTFCLPSSARRSLGSLDTGIYRPSQWNRLPAVYHRFRRRLQFRDCLPIDPRNGVYWPDCELTNSWFGGGADGVKVAARTEDGCVGVSFGGDEIGSLLLAAWLNGQDVVSSFHMTGYAAPIQHRARPLTSCPAETLSSSLMAGPMVQSPQRCLLFSTTPTTRTHSAARTV